MTSNKKCVLVTIPLEFMSDTNTNIFCEKNNKTVKATLEHKSYHRLKRTVEDKYPQCLQEDIGKFLCKLKAKEDLLYKEFLNPHGDKTFSTFRLLNIKHYKLKGVYGFYDKGKLVYIGRCRDSMKKRINNGYGKISPKNCYKDGQSTNCKINALITQSTDIELKLLPLHKNETIEKCEKNFIKKLKPKWNQQL